MVCHDCFLLVFCFGGVWGGVGGVGGGQGGEVGGSMAGKGAVQISNQVLIMLPGK